MKCSEFRERREAEPRRRDDALAAHEAECPACARYAGKARALDDLIHDALRIPVPLGQAAQRSRALPRRWFAMAASLVLAAVLGVLFYVTAPERAERALARNVTAHLEGEAAAVAAMESPADRSAVQSVLSRFNVRLADGIGTVLDARVCIVGGREVVHLVIARPSAPVTVMLIPEQQLARPVPIDAPTVAGPLSGRIQTNGPGSIAIVGHGQPVDRVLEQRLAASVDWEKA